jgi:threonine-phosphate decarboxylase
MRVKSQTRLGTESLKVDRTHGGDNQEVLIDFSTSINPLGPPPAGIEAYKKAAASIAFYPPPYPRALESRITDWLGVDSEQVLAANGSTHLIYLVARVLKLRSPWVVIPTFSEIANALVAAGSTPWPIQTSGEDDFRLEPSAIDAALRSGADGIFLGRPNSPTGNLVTLEEATEIAAHCYRHDAWCVFDEAFIEFADDPHSTIDLVKSFSKVLVLRSLTKIFAIPGLRVGYLVGHAENVGILRAAIEPWSVNVAAAAVSSACFDGSAHFIDSTRELIARERRHMEEELILLKKFRVFPSSANFIMVKVAGEKSEGDFARNLRDRGIVVRDLSMLPGCGSGFYRFGIRTRQDNVNLIEAARDY